MSAYAKVGLLLACATYAQAQYGPNGQYGPNSSNGGNNNGGNDNNGGSNNPSSASGNNGGRYGPPAGFATLVTAHAILGTLAFGLLFPVGGIIIRLASWPGLWWIHGLFQIGATILYLAAFAIGIWMATNMRMLNNSHPIIGILLFALLIFQPVLGFLHHFMFKKHNRRVVWSYGHIWLGRFIITLGIVNGGLGLRLSRQLGAFAASDGAVIAYGVLAGLVWLIYVASAVYGEMKRRRGNSAKGNIMPPPGETNGYRSVDRENKPPQYA